MYAQKISAEGEIQWGAGGISLNGTGGGEGPEIVSDGNGGAIIAWHQYVGVYPNGNIDIYVQKVNTNGSISWAPDGIAICSLPSDQRHVQIASDGNGGAFLTWQYTNNIVCTQRINSDGIYQWRVDGVTVNNFSDSRFPQIATDGGTGVIVTWDTGDGNIFAQRIDSAGTVLWDVDGIGISLDPSPQYEPKIVEDGSGGAIIVWDDYRNDAANSTDIYAQRISGNGTLGIETGMSEKENSLPTGFTLGQNYPNPFVRETQITLTVAIPGFVSLKVFNIQGKEVSTLVNKKMEPGSYTVRFDATGLPGGVYYYCMKTDKETEIKYMILVK